jgi:hypothetical protein
MGKGAGGSLGAATLAAAAFLGVGAHAWADGAVAVGSTGDVVKDGIAFGMVVDEPRETAAETAVKRCRTFKARAAAERCKVVATFSRECFAVAYDPKPGTPGAGWGIGPDQLTANSKAIAMCEETAGPGRKGFCQVESAGCDTTGETGAKTAFQEPAKTAPPEAVPREAPDLDRRWSDLREMLHKEQPSRFSVDAPLLLLLAGTIAGVAYLVNRSLKGRSKAEPLADKPSKVKGKPKAGRKRR